MEAYRDQYATLFNNGRKVVVIGISVDPDTALASWARDEDFPVALRQRSGQRGGPAVRRVRCQEQSRQPLTFCRRSQRSHCVRDEAIQGSDPIGVYRVRCSSGQSGPPT